VNRTFRLITSLLLVVLYSSIVVGKSEVSAAQSPVVDSQYAGYIDQSTPNFQFNYFNNSSECTIASNVVPASVDKNTADKFFAITGILSAKTSAACRICEAATHIFTIKFPPRDISFPFHTFW
jgi:nitric oxide reductase large subunit